MSSKKRNRTGRRPAWRAGGWVIGAVVGIAAGSGAAVATQNWQESREAGDIEHRAERFAHQDVVPPPVDSVRALVEQQSLLAVDPLVADRVPEPDRRRVEEILEGSPVPARIAYLADDEGTHNGYTSSGAAAMWQQAIGETGHYVVLFENGLYESGAIGLEDHYVSTRLKGQPGPALVRLAQEMATWEAEPLPSAPDEPDRHDDWGGIGGGLFIAGLLGVFGVLPLFLVLRWYVGSRRREEP